MSPSRSGLPEAPLFRHAPPPSVKAPTLDFRDVAVDANVTGINVSGSSDSKNYIVETTGNGVAIFDYDGDGLPDILL